MRRINYSVKRNKIKVQKSEFGKFNLENDVIRDVHRVICKKNLENIRRYWAFSAILELELFQLKS
jgi:hypothetical protein